MEFRRLEDLSVPELSDCTDGTSAAGFSPPSTPPADPASEPPLIFSCLLPEASVSTWTFSHRPVLRTVRRRMLSIEGKAVYANGAVEEIDRAWAIEPLERALMLMALAIVTVSVAALALRL